MNKLIFKLFKKEKVSVFPNPATKGKVVNLMINKGNYAVQLEDKNSQAVYEQEIMVANKNEVKLFNIPSNINNGTYYIKVVNKNNQQVLRSCLKVV